MAIPKIIHYCWLSGEPFPPEIQECINSWHRYLPEYELKLWDTNNFDCNKRQYTKQALKQKKYAFVSDVVRLYALYAEGGIYLDSDIMVMRSFDDFLDLPAFSGMESGGRFAAWIMGSEKGNPLFGELLAYYDSRSFISNDGKADLTPNTIPATRVLSHYGMRAENCLQKLDHITIFPEEYFCPKNPWTGEITITENTYAMHLFAGAWNDSSKEDLEYFGNVSAYVQNLITEKKLHKDYPVYIFGAGTVGSLVLESLRLNGIVPSAFIVSHKDNEWDEMDGIPILEMDKCDTTIKNKLVMIAILPKNQNAIYDLLTKEGFTNIICVGN